LGKIYFQAEKYERAHQIFTKAMQYFDEHKKQSDLMFMAGLCMEKLGREMESIECYEGALKLRPL
jgi:TolA-binding protein